MSLSSTRSELDVPELDVSELDAPELDEPERDERARRAPSSTRPELDEPEHDLRARSTSPSSTSPELDEHELNSPGTMGPNRARELLALYFMLYHNEWVGPVDHFRGAYTQNILLV